MTFKIIVTRDDYFVKIKGSKKPDEPFLQQEKYIIRGKKENMEKIGEELKEHIKKGDILGLKYSHSPWKTGRKMSVLITYYDKKNRKKVKRLLEEKGYSPKRKTNYETVLDSLPGGKRFEEEKKRLGKEPEYKKAHIKDCKYNLKLFPEWFDEKQIKKWVKEQYKKRKN